MSELDAQLAARNLVDQWAVRVAGWWPSQDQSEELARAILALVEPSTDRLALALEQAMNDMGLEGNRPNGVYAAELADRVLAKR
jgi:hypothetical protein